MDDGSDDYLFDEIVLDDQTLAVLDSEEQKFLSQAAPPPPKRQKTDNGWRAVPPQGRATVVDDMDDLPEVSVHGDGSYALRGAPKAANRDNTVPPVRKAPPAPRVPQERVLDPPPVPRAAAQPRQDSSSRPRGAFPHTTNNARAPAVQPPPRPPPPEIPHVQSQELLRQMEELRLQNIKYQADLKEANDAKFLKQGEVANLRRNIEKAAQDHAAQIEKLKLAKEEADAKQAAMQKEMKAEMERLKTQYIFKQHELESSARKVPMSARSRRIGREPSTPLPVSSQMRGWNQNGRLVEQTPVRARPVKESPQALRRTPEKSKKLAKLPGFQNSFVDATPVRPSKGKEIFSQAKAKEVFPRASLGREISPPTSPTPLRQEPEDVRMADASFGDVLAGLEPMDLDKSPANEFIPLEEFVEVEPFNWKAELTRLILTHTFASNPSPTFKTLLGLDLPGSAEQYSGAGTRILELVASTAKWSDYEATLPGVCQYLTVMVGLLNTEAVILPLAALLNLLSCLSCSLPTFTSSLLAPAQDADGANLLLILCAIIRTHLEPTKQTQDASALGNETVGLLEALCWGVKDDLVCRLSVLCTSTDVLLILLDTAQPSWLLARTTRLLVFLATYPGLSRDLLSRAEDASAAKEEKAKESARLPHIERPVLVFDRQVAEGSPEAPGQSVDMKAHILTFFGILSVAHAGRPRAPRRISNPHPLRGGLPHPAVDTHLGRRRVLHRAARHDHQVINPIHLAVPFATPFSSFIIYRSIRTLNQTLFLLHHLVFGAEPNVNLRLRLHHAPHRAFSGISHMFIVTFGRLSYADPPETFLDLVVDGPEGDSIWAAYQTDTANDSDTDEEDMEARLLGD
ncbi:hypothetical protein C8J57DRAFT_1460761 [Mycena rebaudengoi]|nr:hypothetical protein C8J57DRAFT_1460761 [Mycena rebaudengoi]